VSRVVDLFVASDEGEPPRRRERVEAVADRGLRGDRYFAGTGYYSPFDVCQVTLIAREAIAAIRAERGIDLADGRHRRNVVVEGVDLEDLLDRRFAVGGATLVGTRPRPPCAHVERVADEAGVAAALGDGRGGICADVVETGEVAAGDAVEPGESLDRTDEIVARLRREAGDDERHADAE